MKKAELLEIFQDNDRDMQERMHASIALRDIEDAEWRHTVQKLQEKFPEKALRRIVLKGFDELISELRKRKDHLYTQNDELRAQGIPFVDRMKRLDVNRIKWMDEYEAKLLRDMRHFRVRPLIEWIDRIDLKMARERSMGLGWIIKVNLARTYEVPNKA